jgi:CheY-like chemotaxis protein/HPt (histidine-containing phosphotransfer) domain-containing protein
VTVVDSGHLSSGMGLLVILAAKLAADGCGRQRILEDLEWAKKAVSTSFVVQNTEFLYRCGKLPEFVKNLCDCLLLHPVLCMKKSALRVKTVLVGQWKNVMRSYVSSILKRTWNIDRNVLFITHVNLDEKSKEYLLEEVTKICPFQKIYFQKVSPAIACNCGPGSFGLMFMRKIKEPRKAPEEGQITFVDRVRGLAGLVDRLLLKDEYTIQHKMLNLILGAALIGGIGSLSITLAIQAWLSAGVTALLLCVVGLSIYISIIRNNVKVAGLIITFFANMVIFPLMFFTSGGINSSMPMWFVLGLVFDFLILKGWTSLAMFTLNLIVMIGCILAADSNPALLTDMPEGYQMTDVVQAIFFVSCIFGVIFKYQTRLYEKQRMQLLNHEQELLTANSAKSSFLANMSHEIRVRQIINNLLSNGVKYTETGMVELSLDYVRKSDISVELVISARDTGIGIRKEDISKLFESFTRVDEKRNSNIEGTGLGLNLTKKLVELMHGEITVNSVYNQGSVFTVRIPQIVKSWEPVGDYSEQYQELLKQKDTLSEVVYAPDAHVLVVDDVPMNLLVAKGLLKYTGMHVDTAAGGLEALELIGQKRYHLIFMDHLMPVMDGVECLHHIRERKEHPNVTTPIIILTANAIRGAREEYIQAGFTDYLPKPIQEREMQSMLLKYLPKELVKLRRMDDQVPVASSDLPFIERLKAIGELDTSVGMDYCMDNEEFYQEMLEVYLTSAKAESMTQYFAAQDWENYRITVHALKSTSLTIGAVELSEQAKALEMACKENNITYVQDNHMVVLKRYEGFLDALKVVLDV